jgi:hypothetical protein
MAPGVQHVLKADEPGLVRSAYHGHAGDTRTITSSNVKAIEVGTRIVYASHADFPLLATDVVLDPPGPGNNKAFGHCALNLQTGVGQCTLSGGTGKFTWIHARVDVSHLGGPNFAWNRMYASARAIEPRSKRGPKGSGRIRSNSVVVMEPAGLV